MAEASTKRVLAIVGLWAIVMGATSFASGCYGRNCEGDVQTYGRNPGEGRLIDENTWESTPIDGQWIPFPKQRLWIFELDDLAGRTPSAPIVYVSAQQDPMHEPGGNYTIAAGNLAEQSGASPGRLVVRNGTCADYFIRVVVPVPPLPPATPAPSDAGSD